MLKFLILTSMMISESISITNNQTTTTKIEVRKKKLWFLFPNKHNKGDLADFYCPRKHIVTMVEDLCYYFYRHKKTNELAEQACGNVSHRLVYIDSDLTWSALLYAADKFVKRVNSTINSNTNENNPTSRLPMFRFHVGRRVRILSNNKVRLHKYGPLLNTRNRFQRSLHYQIPQYVCLSFMGIFRSVFFC